MNNNKFKSYGLAAGVFVICAGVGFFAPKSCSNNQIKKGPDTIPIDTIPTDTIPTDTIPTDTTSVENSEISVSTPMQINGKYAFNAKCSGASTYHLYSNGGKTLVKESKTGSFTDVIANASNYVVVALDASGHVINKQMVTGIKQTPPANPAEVASTEAPKESNAQLTSLINGNSNNYPRGIKIYYTNLEGDEEAQQNIANIRQYIKTGIWKSVSVVGATYSGGKVTSLTLQINR